MPPALLALEDLQIELGGALALRAGRAEAGDRVLALLGDWTAWFQAISGQVSYAGRVLMLGVPVASLLASGGLGLALTRVELPEKLRLSDVLTQRLRARSPGLSRRAVSEAVTAAVERTELRKAAKLRIGKLSRLERRLFCLALGDVVNASILAVEDPFAELDEGEAETVERVLGRLAEGRRLIFSNASALERARRSVERADARLYIEHGQVMTVAGAATPERAWRVTTVDHVTELAERLRADGAQVTGPVPLGVELLRQIGGRATDGGHLSVSLSEGMSTRAIIDAAVACDAAVIELLPLLTADS